MWIRILLLAALAAGWAGGRLLHGGAEPAPVAMAAGINGELLLIGIGITAGLVAPSLGLKREVMIPAMLALGLLFGLLGL